MATLAFPPTATSFPSASTSNPGSPTFPHSQSLSLNGAGFALALRPGTSVGNRPPDILPPSAALPDEPPTANGRTYLAFIKSWDDDHVGRWLYEVHVGQYADVFRTNDIRGDVLLDVDQQALKEMGVRSVGDRVKITVAIKALRQRCVKTTMLDRASMPPRLSSYGSMASIASNGTSSSSVGTVGRRPGSGRGSGRIPPPLHLSQSNTAASLPQAWQPSTTPGSSRLATSQNSLLLNPPSTGLTPATSPRTSHSPGRNIPPPSLPPPRSQPPPAPNASSRTSPPTTQSSLPRFGAPSISTTAASPTSSSFPANGSTSSSGYGLPRAPNAGGGAFNPRSSSTSPAPPAERKMGSPQRPPTGVVPPRPATTTHGRAGSTSASPGRPSTTPGSSPYGHNQPLSTHPYATSTSPTSDGFSNTIYGRPIPASLPTKSPLTLLPSPPIVVVPGAEGYTTSRTKPTTPGGMSSLDAVMRKAVKFIGDDGVSKMIAVADCSNGREVLVRVLRKFQVLGAGAASGGEGEEGEGWGVYVTSDGQVQRLLSEAELFAVCRDGQAPERQRGLTLRRIKDYEATKRGRKLQWMFGVPSPPDSTRPGGVSATSPTSPNSLGVGIPSTTIEPASPSLSTSSDFERAENVAAGDRRLKRASTISIMSSLGVDYPDSFQPPTHSPSSGSFLSSGRKLRNFFGQRPPSELIATHLTEYFPKAEKNKLLSKQVRQSMRKSMVRRESQYSVVDTSWEKAPDRYSLNPTTQSRFSGSSGGSIRSSVQLATAGADKEYPTTPPRFGGARSQADNISIRSSAPPSILEPPDESAEDDDGADARSIAASRSSRRSRRSEWDGRSKDSDSASMITVDEVTAELETRRESLESYMSGEEEDEVVPGEGETRPPSIEFSLEEDVEEEDESDEDESGSEEEESEDEEVPAEAVSSKPALKWIKGALIGSGSFGSVYLGMNPMSGSLMAVKQVELPTGNSHNEERKKSMLDALEREIELLKVLQHENIVQYLDSSSDATHLNIFLEYVPGGSVAALLSNYGAFEEALVSKFVRQILTGLEYLHEREIIHRDIKGANILVDNNGGIKISDFGISKKVEDNLLSGSKVHRPSLQGSVYWMAPEVVKQTAYTSKADIWSLGCLVVEMLTGVHPWANLTQMQAIFRIGSSACPTIPDDLSTDAEDFLEQTFLIDYKERPPARELLQHAFIKEVDARTAEQQTPTRATFSQQNSPVKAEVAS